MSASLLTIDFYAYWNGDSVASLFQMLAGLTNTSDYMQLLKCTALLSLIAAAVMACVRNRGGDIITWFAATVLFFMIAFVPRVTVNVVDVRALSAKAVENVPIGVGFTAGLTSTVGKWLAEAFETAFADVDAERFTKFGAAFPERVVEAIHKTGPILPETRALLDPFVEHCITPELLDDEGKLMELMNSTNLLATIGQAGWVNPSRFILADGKPLYCDAALVKLKTHLTAKEIPAQEKLLFTKLSGSETALVEAALRKAIPEAQALLLGTSMAMNESLQHSMLMTAVPEGVLRTAGKDGSPIAASVQLSKSQGNMASEIAFRTMSEIASAFLPKLRNILEFIVIAAFPIVFLLVVAMGPSGGIVIRAYFTLFVWLMLWAPLAAVVNYLLVHIDANPMNRLVEQFGGVTMQSADLIRDLGASSQAMAGYLMLLIPVVSFMLARASEMSTSSLASSVMAPAGSAAQAQSANLAMGNISGGNASLGNVSAGNTNMHKTDMSDSFTAGSVSKNSTPYGTVVRNNATGAVTAMRVESSNLGFSAQGILSEGEVKETASSSGVTTAFTQGYGQSSTTTLNETTSKGFSKVEAQSNSKSSSNGTVDNILQSKTTSDAISFGETISYGRNANVSENLAYHSKVGMDGDLRTSNSDSGFKSQVNTKNDSGIELTNIPTNHSAISSMVPKIESIFSNIGTNLKPIFANSIKGVRGDIGINGNTAVAHSDFSSNISSSGSQLSETLTNSTSHQEMTTNSRSNESKFTDSRQHSKISQRGNAQNETTDMHSTRTNNASDSTMMRSNVSANTNIATDFSNLGLSKLNNEFSSAEDALEWLSSPQNRRSFAETLNIKKTSIPGNIKSNHIDPKPNSMPLDNQPSALSFDINDAQKMGIDHSSKTDEQSVKAGSFDHSSSAFMHRGIEKVTAAMFDENAISLSGLGSLLMPFVGKYRTPNDLRSHLSDLAFKNPDLSNFFEQIGQTRGTSNEDIIKSFNQIKVPRLN